MNNNTNPLLPSSLSKVESNSSLTIDINQANLPSGPNLLPPPMVPPPVITGSKQNDGEQKNLPSNQFPGIPPPIPMSPIPSVSSSRPTGQMRSRYVLPPQLSQSPAPTSSETLPTLTPNQPETSFSSVTVLPTPSFSNTSGSSESVQRPSDTASFLSSTTIIPTPSYFNVHKSIESEQPSTSSLPTMTVLPTPSYYNLSGSNPSQQKEARSTDDMVSKVVYEAPSAHWFYSTKTANHGIIWWPFSQADAQKLENASMATNLLSVKSISANTPNTAVSVRCGLYDVLLRDRVYKPVYWPADEEEAGEVRRVTWLYRKCIVAISIVNKALVVQDNLCYEDGEPAVVGTTFLAPTMLYASRNLVCLFAKFYLLTLYLPLVRPQNEQRVLPCSEAMCERLEENYRRVLEANSWGEQFLVTDEDAPSGQCTCIFHNSKVNEKYFHHEDPTTFKMVKGGLDISYSILKNAMIDYQYSFKKVAEAPLTRRYCITNAVYTAPSFSYYRPDQLKHAHDLTRALIQAMNINSPDTYTSDTHEVVINKLSTRYSADSGYFMLMLHYHKESESSSETYSDCAYLHRGLRDDLASQLPPSDERPIEHVVFVVHGIGSVYNMRGEGLISCVNDMRKTALGLFDSHFKDKPQRGRVEFLPVRWHSSLHSEEVGVNNRLKRVTLRSIPKLRSYTNETLTDILFYSSPKYCQHIVDTVAATIKQLRKLFLQRNPDYKGDFSVAGHSLGAVIVFDLLSHQRRTPSSTPSVKSTNGGADEDEWSLVDTNSNSGNGSNNNAYLINHLHMSTDLSEEQIRQVVNALTSTNKTLEVGAQSAGIGLPVVNYPQLGFAFSTCFLLGSPLALFLVARGVERLSSDFRFPTCQRCVNIFHPFDPVAYRLENLVIPEYRPCAVLMPHHAGRKRLHLELKDNIARVGADITSKFYQSLKSTWRSLQEFASAHTSSGTLKSSEDDAAGMSEEEKDSEAIKRVLSRLADNINAPKSGHDFDYDEEEEEEVDQDLFPCQLNQGRRLDYVLQVAR
ncbi:hypothetical protein ACTXT7_004703 [Hymenolepis weldensis]